jgi:hypothetical protein
MSGDYIRGQYKKISFWAVTPPTLTLIVWGRFLFGPVPSLEKVERKNLEKFIQNRREKELESVC